MKTGTFDLLSRPWLPCSTRDGVLVEVGLLDVFRRGHQLVALADNSPLVRVSLYRLLLAILYRTQSIDTREDWLRLWREGLDLGAIESYLEHWRDRFDLFSPTYPFFQRAEFDPAGKRTPVAKLAHEFVSGLNKQLFDHSCDDAPAAFDAATAARLLVTAQGWSIGGGKSGHERPNFTSGPLVRGACVMPLGNTLAQTLLLNLVPRDMLRSTPRQFVFDDSADFPAWERAGEPMVIERRLCGIADYYTWCVRYVRLIPEADGSVREAIIVQGERIATTSDSDEQIDPLHAYEMDKDGARKTRQVSKGRAAWRDATSLLNTAGDPAQRGACCALTLAGYVRCQAVPPLPRLLPVFVAGVAIPGGQPPPDMWIGETFRIPGALLDSTRMVERLKRALTLAQDIAGVLRGAVRLYAQRMMEHQNGSADKDAVTKLADALCRETDYWAALEVAFHTYLVGLADEQQLDENEQKWKDAVRQAAIDAFERSLASQDVGGRHLRALNAAMGYFRSSKKGLYKYIPKEDENDGDREGSEAQLASR